MGDFEKLYTVEDIARITGFTSRTIRNYLKEGSLRGKKIGGQWRFTMEDIKGLMGGKEYLKEAKNKNKRQVLNFLDGVDPAGDGGVRVCAVVDYYCAGVKEGYQMYQKLVPVINAHEGAPARFDYDFIEVDSKARFTLIGSPEYITKTLQQIA